MPTGLNNSIGLGMGVQAVPGWGKRAINQSHYIILSATGVAQRCRGIVVPPGCLVSIRAHNGTLTGNAQVVRIGDYPEQLTGIGGVPITPDTDISWPASKLDSIWLAGTEGDGVCVSIQKGVG